MVLAPAQSVHQQLAQQGVDATIYQNASAEVYRLYQQGYELARVPLGRQLGPPKCASASSDRGYRRDRAGQQSVPSGECREGG
jgi:hypothetical protein